MMENSITEKRCPKCGETDLEKFGFRPNGKLKSWCNKCAAIASKKWVKQHPEKQKQYRKRSYYKDINKSREYAATWQRNNPDKSKKWKSENKEKVKGYIEKYKTNNRDEVLRKARERQNLYNQSHREETNKRQRIYNTKNRDAIAARRKKRYQEKKEKIAAQSKVYRESNKEKLAERARVYYKNNPDNFLIYRHRRRANEKGAEGSFTKTEWIELCEKYGNKCLKCGKKTKMSPDHVIPISKGGTSWITNIQPLCLPCNIGKKDKIKDYR